MNTITWIFSGVLAVVFTISGVLKAVMSRARLIATGQTGIAPFPMPLVRFVAVCELLAVAGLFAPWLTDTARILTPLAAVGLCVVMIGAATSHSSLREPGSTAANTILLALAAFVAAARFAGL
ncbi:MULTISPECIES: DoxX family protein [Kribbella]|uniref:DoxX-like protein n=1 Tax=Kribbella pratensis TaxID=2512112 RepID=A0ABY2FM18_9ACTN|nr:MULTISPECIES: DoxX family protein [Kribbella]TDW94172.1 DoxX-like protein [Kribbella pratensis]TDX02778.1 DoxX-like protein [Kribbella sp. VKM Ac-2566]